MNIDSLPLTAFALEASGAAAQAMGSAHTLTLKTAAAMPPGAIASIVVRDACEAASVTVLSAQAAPVLVLTF